MKIDWLVVVLSDLAKFAKQNDLPLLAEQLDDTAIVALTEISSVTISLPTYGENHDG